MRFRILNVLTKSSGITDNGELMSFDEVVDKLNCFDKEVKELKGQVIKLELLNNDLSYALENIKKIDVEIDLND